MSKKKGIIVSGYFNPIHKGHIEYLINAKALSDELFVIVNNDNQRALKGSEEFQQEAERVFIVSNIKSVDYCILSIDQDRTVCKTIEKIALDFGEKYDLSPTEEIKTITVSPKGGFVINWEYLWWMGSAIKSSRVDGC